VVFAALVLFLAPFSYLVFVHYPVDADLRRSILICGAINLGGFLVVLRLIPVAARYLLRRRLYGKDINKKGLLEGEVTALVTSTISITCSALCVFRSILCFMILLGFIDDVLDIPWRVYVLSHSVIHFIPIESLSCF
jgi:UDP-N-acetylglucosamine--dolichyl-phosphate N-acetylglucosaminephosphotransferase